MSVRFVAAEFATLGCSCGEDVYGFDAERLVQDDGRMAPFPADMDNLDRPLTVREFRADRAELEAVLKTLATKDDLKAVATTENLKAFETKEDLKAMRQELRCYIDVLVDTFKAEFNDRYD